MRVVFDKCYLALDYAINTKSFGIFHSTENNPDSDMHTHECCEVFLCIKGGSTFLIDGRVYEANDGDIFFMNQYEAHKITFKQNCDVERYVLQIHPEFIMSFSTENTNLANCFYKKNKYNKISLDKENFDYIKNLFSDMESEYKFADDIIKQSKILLILSQINILSYNIHGKNSFVIPEKELTDALSYIDSHFCENITLSDIATHSFISVNKLCRIFKSGLGTTPAKYITSKRISKAKKMLLNGVSVLEVAYSCGFNDYSNFIRTFSARVGISPGKYSKSLH